MSLVTAGIVKTFVDCGLQSGTVTSTASTEVAACQAQIIVEPLSPSLLGGNWNPTDKQNSQFSEF